MKPMPINPNPPEETPQRKRLLNRQGSILPMKGGIFMVVFGGIFFLVGATVVCLELGIFDVQNVRKNAPPVVILGAGAMFMVVGFFILLGALVGFLHQARIRRAQAAYPQEPAMKDYPWNPEGVTYSRWAEVVKAGWPALMVAFMMIPFNWWAFFSGEGPIPVKLIVILFDAILIFLIWGFIRRLLQAVRFSPGRVTWREFPLRCEGPVELFWTAPTEAWSGGHFTLRCAEESTQTTIRNGKASKTNIQEEIWSQRIDAGTGLGGAFGEPIRLLFQPPSALPGTDFSGERLIFWELELELETPGVNRTEQFLIPVYAKATGV